jgi:hypothetical protein
LIHPRASHLSWVFFRDEKIFHFAGGAAIGTKKVKGQVATAQARGGIRHPVVSSSINAAAVVNKKDKASTTLLLPLDGDPSGTSSSQQEMRRSVSSTCLDVPTVRSDSLRRLSIPDVNRLTDNMLLSSSILASNFVPSQSGIALISSATQTELPDSTRRISELGDREFLSLLEEHSQMSKQLSELCKVDGLPSGGESGDGDAAMSMDTSATDGGSLARLTPSVNDWDAQSNNSLCSEPSLAGLQVFFI